MNAVDTKIWQQKQKQRRTFLRNAGRDKSAAHSRKRIFSALLFVALALPLIAYAAYFYRQHAGNSALEFFGNIIVVKAGGDFQAALNRAKAGDTIQLQAGATFKGAFTLPNKAGNEFITVRTSATDAQLPTADTRIDPKKYAAVLPKLISTMNEPVITATDGAHNYRFVGVEFEANPQGVGNVIKIGTSEEKRIEDLPHHIEYDRVYIHGNAQNGARRGIAANGRDLKIANSYISDIKRKGDESSAIGIWATDGRIEITNNYLEAAGENILFGGAESYLKLIPSDCLIKNNWMNKPLKWREEGWDVKNLFEIKNGRRIRIENNLLTNNWAMAQDGTAILFTTRADNGDASVIEDIEFIGNIVRGSASAVSVYGAEGSGGHRLTIRNNLFADIDGRKWGGAGIFLKSTAWDGLVIENNTAIQTANIANAYDVPVKNFVFRNNIIFQNEYGFAGDSTAPGQKTIDKFFPGGDVSFNAIVGGDAVRYPGKNMYPVSIKQLGFVNFQAGDFTLLPDSPLRAKGFQGKNIGADLDARAVGGK